MVKRAYVLSQLHRIADRRHDHRNTEPNFRGNRGDIAQETKALQKWDESGNLILSPKAVKAKFLGSLEALAQKLQIRRAFEENLRYRRAEFNGFSCHNRISRL